MSLAAVDFWRDPTFEPKHTRAIFPQAKTIVRAPTLRHLKHFFR